MCEEKSERQFLASNLNIHSIYELYQSENDIEVNVGEQTYTNIFNTCFNLSFHELKKNPCKTCTEYENATPLLEDVVRREIPDPNKPITRDVKDSEKLLSRSNPQSIVCIAFDLQKVVNVSSSENSLFHYTVTLAVYNLTITDLVNKNGFCYT